MNNKPDFKNDQRGMVSIVVAMLIILLVSLITLGFAQLVRREQRQSLDRQLSTQAFYAAETGINDASKAIKEALENNQSVADKTNCGPEGIYSANNQLSEVVEYSCLLVDADLETLIFDSIDTAKAEVTMAKSGDSNPLSRLTIAWQDKSGGNSFTGCPAAGQFPPAWPSGGNGAGNCSSGILRIDLVPLSAVNRPNLINNTMTVFLHPTSSNSISELDYGGSIGRAGQGRVWASACNTTISTAKPKFCSVTINGLTATSYAIRMQSIYRESEVTILAESGRTFVGGQAIIDSTGKASDVLRRIQVRLPVDPFNDDAPPFAIQTSETQCKLFAIAGSLVIDDPAYSGVCDIRD